MLSKQKLEEMKEKLKKEKLQILSDIFGEEMAIKYFTNNSEGDIVDRASDFYESQLLASISGIQREIIDKINDALKRIDEGTYGKCRSCGVDIEIERLEAIPYTDICSNCARKKQEARIR
ncbi:MAG: TraR/DksA C4-type zinc finger protein [Brevinematales bacterium]|nr:TraR/DksA C4-type zinc finger protein [Brevinematales bacterium]